MWSATRINRQLSNISRRPAATLACKRPPPPDTVGGRRLTKSPSRWFTLARNFQWPREKKRPVFATGIYTWTPWRARGGWIKRARFFSLAGRG